MVVEVEVVQVVDWVRVPAMVKVGDMVREVDMVEWAAVVMAVEVVAAEVKVVVLVQDLDRGRDMALGLVEVEQKEEVMGVAEVVAAVAV